MFDAKRILIAALIVGLAALWACDSPEESAEAEPAEDESALEVEEGAEEEDDEEEEAAQAPTEPVIGELAPDFTLIDETGQEHTLSDYRGQTVVLEWFNIPCPFVVRHYEANTFDNLHEEFGSDDFVWLAIDTTWDNTPEDTIAWKAETEEIRSHDYPVLQDPEGEVGRLYGAQTTPHMFVIDEEGILQYMGAIDDDPRGRSDEPTNYVAAALTAMRDGADVDPSETDPYGCTVKYDEES